ncbi:MAG: NADH:flavin oxidoreductase [Clostridia bacterium]|nr:NADH:flavin oxidoreductase [Clostridia bacterium]MDR3643977.1 NADH:flavin oxidoreductase [Clostridia bacterium]
MAYLNSPLKTGKLTLEGRLVMPPMATSKSDADGRITPELIRHYDERSRGGYISLVVVEHSFVSLRGKASGRQLSVAGDDSLDDLKKLAETIHRNGSKTVMQLNHAGSSAYKKYTGMEPVGPSAILNPSKNGDTVPQELDRAGISEIIADFTKAAVRVRDAGFDGVEIHSAHGYLLDQFLSPLTNKRADEYGGGIEGRIRIHLEIIRAVRGEVGDDFPLLLRLGATDYMEGGLTSEDSLAAARAFEKAGVDMLDISGGMCFYTIPGGPGYFTPYSKPIKEAVSIPVIVTGGVAKASEAEAILRDGKADLVGVGRAIFADPEWAKNAMESL